MTIFDGLLGNATQVELADVQREYARILAPGEKIERAYKLIRDMFIFTDKRLILVDKQGVTGKKTQYHSIPYKSISHYSVETAGHFDLDAELCLYVSSSTLPLKKTFNKSVNIYEVQAVLSQYILK
ncbi:cytoplasmic protein [Paenibacillus sp. FSL R7-0273]|uniref:PH domain-containing protein n=1 Tax=Paenibacillus sp. FSL R7-0273 TaxID=1536772 RepID=UPI0004F8A85E|nr:PH domain-containing protein [Paenibacillus sp. FSL R7-0273]AIQ45651.1 cytoplasmic protein [Paenibacillus sp. FSL R7-0273]OMF95173.1 cytoplasmic protein [Paenibacillus sp. FSL R7-0273]